MVAQSVKVLVVDDEEGIVDFMQRILRLRGFETMGETDGLRAVDLFERERPQVALIDVQLADSGFNGLRVLESIKRSVPQTACVMVTRITDQGVIDRAKELGAAHYLLKPMDTKEWLGVVLDISRSSGSGV